MATLQNSPPIRLFYSYSHIDAEYRESMETSLAMLRKEHLLQEWSDQQILPGQSISSEIRTQMNEAHILIFLLSPDFIASEECTKEWDHAKQLTATGKVLFRIPIILRVCPWQDLLGDDDVKALPNDANPIALHSSQDTAWLQVYEGIKAVVNELRRVFIPKTEFIDQIEQTDFFSNHRIKLQDTFTFLRMTIGGLKESDHQNPSTVISDVAQLLSIKYALIHGDEKMGKTALARFLFLSLLAESKPVLLLDMAKSGIRPNESFLQNLYSSQFDGDYHLWTQQPNKTLIIDNMTSTRRSLDFVLFSKGIFDRIIVIQDSDVFYSFFMDESRLAAFQELKLEPLTRSQQEQLIRKRAALFDSQRPVSDGFIDQIEDRVNSVIVSNRIVPRYPFYVLSILQTYEEYMPSQMSITSYGHCYYVLIVASLIKAGISKADKDVNTCFNFCEQLALAIYRHYVERPDESFRLSKFIVDYKERFIITDATINRLRHDDYGILNNDGSFRKEYMYYFFLGKMLSRSSEATLAVIEEMCEQIYVESNYLTLLFTIHHTNDDSLINDILSKTEMMLGEIRPATLESEETKRFGRILAALPEEVLSNRSVEETRESERDLQDNLENAEVKTQSWVAEPEDERSAIYRIFKNNKIMGQVLRNKHGSLEKVKIEKIVETIVDSGLRLVNAILKDEEEITRFARYIKSREPEWDIERIKEGLEVLSFSWTMINITLIVDSVNVPEIRVAVNSAVKRQGTPAYDLVGFFNLLDSADKLSERERRQLEVLWKKHSDQFIRHVLSIRTQHYMNTHRSKTPIEQAVCSLLQVKYVPRMLSAP